MKRMLLLFFALLLSGCATTIRTQVTSFHEWPNYVQDKSYVFERTKAQDNDLEYRNYENLVRAELKRLGFEEASSVDSARLTATITYNMRVRDVHAVYPVVVDPYWYGPPWRGYYWPYYGPYYPYWYGPPVVERREENYQLFTRQLRFVLTRNSDGKRVYESTAVSEDTIGSLAAAMPYMVRAAFADFPGQNGVPHVVEMTMQ